MAEKPQGGLTGEKMGEVHVVFHNRLTDLRDQAKRMHNALQGKAQRQWQIPSDFTGSLLDIAELHNPSFDRTKINDNYEQAVKDPDKPGTNGDVIGLKLQIDYNACEERAFRARHTTLCRAMCLGHARRYGQGHGGLWGSPSDPRLGIEAAVSGFIAAGGVAAPGGNT